MEYYVDGPFAGLPVYKNTTVVFTVKRKGAVWTGRYIECMWVKGS